MAEKDEVAMGVGMVLFWPALFFLAEGEDQKVEIGRLKGQYETIKNVATKKKCSFASEMVPLPSPEKNTSTKN